MAYIIIGATGGLGRALADRLAAKGAGLVLVARNEAALQGLAAELRDRRGIDVAAIAADVARGTGYLDAVIDAVRDGATVDGLLMPVGLALRDDLGTAPDTLRQLGGANFFAAAEAVTRLWPLLSRDRATVVGFGSITAIRGRRRNLVYGAMKRALGAYFESLRVIARGSTVSVQFWVLGFLDTDNMRGETTPLPKGDPAKLAAKVVDALGRDTGVRYYPGWWRPIALVLRLLPWAIYARIAGR